LKLDSDSDLSTDLWDLDKFSEFLGGNASHLFGQTDLLDTIELPPKAEVETTMARFESHAEQTKAAALATHASISKKMEEAVHAGQMLDASILVELNDAIKKDKIANELVEMASRYKGKVEDFFEAIDRAKLIRDQRAQALEDMKAEHAENEAQLTLERETKAIEDAQSAEARAVAMQNLQQAEAALATAIADQKKAQEKLRHSQNRGEILEAKKLLELFDTIKGHYHSIKDKDKEISANIHPDVKSTTETVQSWANDEMSPLCRKYMKIKLVTKQKPGATCREAVEILIPHVEKLEAKEMED
jgi:hypothetical protein